MNCDAIRGTDYCSAEERTWFLNNCTDAQGCFCFDAQPAPGSAFSGQTAIPCGSQSCEIDGHYWACNNVNGQGVWSEQLGACQ
jgi:hypothetical protein